MDETRNHKEKRDKGKEVDPEEGMPLNHMTPQVGSSEAPTEETEDLPVVSSCFSKKNPIPRARRWGCFCFTLDRQSVVFFAKTIFAYIMGFYCFAMLAYLVITGGSSEYIALYFGLLMYVVGFFLGNVPKMKQAALNVTKRE